MSAFLTEEINLFLPVIFSIVLVAASIFMFLPVFAMFARGEENHIFKIMDVIKRIPGIRTNPSQIALAFKNQHIFPKGRDGVVF